MNPAAPVTRTAPSSASEAAAETRTASRRDEEEIEVCPEVARTPPRGPARRGAARRAPGAARGIADMRVETIGAGRRGDARDALDRVGVKVVRIFLLLANDEKGLDLTVVGRAVTAQRAEARVERPRAPAWVSGSSDPSRGAGDAAVGRGPGVASRCSVRSSPSPSRRGIYGDGNTRHSSLTPSSTPSIEETPSGEANET